MPREISNWNSSRAKPPPGQAPRNPFGSIALNYAVKLIIFSILLTMTANASETEGASSVEPNVLRWATASEKDNFGYDVYRSLNEAGPFERINPEIIPGAGTTDLPQHYEYTDKAIEPNTVYWYYIESISLNGDRKRMTPIYPSPPKASPP